MKSVIKFLSSPLFNFIVGIVLIFLNGGLYVLLSHKFDPDSALWGCFFVIALDIFSYGFRGMIDYVHSKMVDQDLDD